MDEQLSPSQAYASFRARAAEMESPFETFRLSLDYGLDDFQIRACKSLQAGKSVLVAAPTGAGKTVVAEFAVALADAQDVRVFYTAPIKALSNQKYQELCEHYGTSRVGLLTGDTTINRDAQIVVMTTEVLRNMIYSGTDLTSLGYVVLDEVHYLGDRFRGPVWEEVIIHLPAHVALVSLSATVSNAEEFGAWLGEVRGSTDVIVSEHRPVPLHNHVSVGTELFPLFEPGSARSSGGTGSAGSDRINRELQSRIRPFTGRGGSQRDRRRGVNLRFRRPSRTTIIRELAEANLLPAIFFIFSRNGCDDAVEQCLTAGVDLTTREEKTHILERIDALAEELDGEDLSVLGFHSFQAGLVQGFGAHHAGLIPVFKELVEELFKEGYLRVVFATETLALGVNMPARTVVLEKLTKFNGESHVQITPGEFTQLTGRAGRRGIDVEGHSVVVWHPSIELGDIASLASKRTYALRSRFTPTYNMTANLLARMTREDAEKVLETSFAQFQADKGVVELARRVRKNEEALAGYRKSMECERGDFYEYAQLRQTLSDMEKRAGRSRSRLKQKEIVESLGALRPGDVVTLPGSRVSGPAVVIAPMQNRDGVTRLPSVLTDQGKVWHLRPHEVTAPAQELGRIKVPKNFNHRQAKERRNLLASLHDALESGRVSASTGAARKSSRGPKVQTDEIEIVREQLRAHPCHACPDREIHARWANRASKLMKEGAALTRQIEGRTSSIAKVFVRVQDVLTTLGFLPDDSRILRRIYGERDLLTAMTVRAGMWDVLSEPEVAAFASCLVYEARRAEGLGRMRYPTASLEAAVGELHTMWQNLYRVEDDARLPTTPEPDPGLVGAMFRWAEGASLSRALGRTDIAAGDFVRWTKQTLDLLGQVSDVCRPETAVVIRRAAEAIRRGVVAD
ncbi:DEAD/DEAH box helicase [Brevibacterium samyangense]|uniref:DEAD/DEAH box helicase n=1 Tax=Brevibacterium samyangense TaxID=366888 RepID=A0ABP5F5J2_9MICO